MQFDSADPSRIVVVDDDEPSAEVARALLGRAGMSAVQVVNAPEEFLARYDELSPDLVVLDLNMPVIDGYAVLSELRLRVPAPELPILVVTADATRRANHRALALGASDFLTKPIDALELVLRVRNLLAARAFHMDSHLQRRWLEASLEIGAQTSDMPEVNALHTIAERVLDIADGDQVTVELISPDRSELVVEVALGRPLDRPAGRRVRLADHRARQVVGSGEPMLFDAEPVGSGRSASPDAGLERGYSMALALRGSVITRGVITVARGSGRPLFSSTQLAMAAGFASHVGIALDLADARAADRTGLLLQERDRIANDLNENVMRELFAIGLTLAGLATEVQHNRQLARRIRQCVDETDRLIDKVRASIFKLGGDVTP